MDFMKVRIPTGIGYSIAYPISRAIEGQQKHGGNEGIKRLMRHYGGFDIEKGTFTEKQFMDTYIPLIIAIAKHKLLSRANRDLKRAGIPFISI